MANKNSKYVVLRGIELGNVFWTMNSSDDPTVLGTGEVAYEVVGYADTPEEAIAMWSIERVS